MLSLRGVKTYGRLTQNSGTKIVRCIEPSKGSWTNLLFVEAIVGATAHILTVMKPLGATTVNGAAATGQAVVNITADPLAYTGWGTAATVIATGDFCAVECVDGLIHFGTITLATLAVTFAGNLPAAVADDAKFWCFGAETDTNPFDGLAHPRFTLPASGTLQRGGIETNGIGFMQSNRIEEPMLLVIDNGTNASTLEQVTVAYNSTPGRFWDRADATYFPDRYTL